ncbi:MAG: hypothetical protein ACREDO_12600 [Methyloceanibacter sp.]
MNYSKFVVWMVAFLVVIGISCLAPTSAEETIAGDKSLIQPQEGATESSAAASHAPKAPIRIKTVDFQDAGDEAGKLRLAGTAKSDTPLYLFLDNEPFAKVIADAAGEWSVEGELKLADGMHTLRAEQYDPATRMLAGRAMVSIERGKPGKDPGVPGRAAMPRPMEP